MQTLISAMHRFTMSLRYALVAADTSYPATSTHRMKITMNLLAVHRYLARIGISSVPVIYVTLVREPVRG